VGRFSGSWHSNSSAPLLSRRRIGVQYLFLIPSMLPNMIFYIRMNVVLSRQRLSPRRTMQRLRSVILDGILIQCGWHRTDS
jgi:hypothetical protein